LIFLKQTLVDITDEIIEMFDRCFMETYARARRNLDEFRKANSCQWRSKIPHFRRDKNPHVTILGINPRIGDYA